MFSQHTPSVSPTGQPLITTEFDASSTASEVVVGHDLSGLRVVVTGGASGIGLPTARALVAAGADVTIARRDVAAGAGAAASMSHHGGGGTARAGVLDLADAASVARFAESGDGPLHLLVANAGVVTGGLERTREGWELQLATNHLGHLALAQRLRGALTAGASDRGAARVVVLSSTAHMRAGVDFDDLQFERRPYNPQTAYAQSKTANSLFAVELTRRWQRLGVVANAVNPGGVVTGLQRHFTRRRGLRSTRPRQRASSPTRRWTRGRHLVGRRRTPLSPPRSSLRHPVARSGTP